VSLNELCGGGRGEGGCCMGLYVMYPHTSMMVEFIK
jgi:hypothetical protein